MIFSTINRTQKRVSQDLVYSLFSLSTNDTPYKTALEVVLSLNGHPKSPFYKRIKLYGGSYDKRISPPLSQATMIKNIVALISENLRESENDKYRRRNELKKQNGKKFLPFRQFYANNEDYKISDCLYFYFNATKHSLGRFWNYNVISSPQNILQSTVGFEALLLLMKDILERDNIRQFDRTTFPLYIEKNSNIEFDNIEKFPMSTKGRKILYLTMNIAVFPPRNEDDDRVVKLRELESL